jgi:hypothetical protein
MTHPLPQLALTSCSRRFPSPLTFRYEQGLMSQACCCPFMDGSHIRFQCLVASATNENCRRDDDVFDLVVIPVFKDWAKVIPRREPVAICSLPLTAHFSLMKILINQFVSKLVRRI